MILPDQIFLCIINTLHNKLKIHMRFALAIAAVVTVSNAVRLADNSEPTVAGVVDTNAADAATVAGAVEPNDSASVIVAGAENPPTPVVADDAAAPIVFSGNAV